MQQGKKLLADILQANAQQADAKLARRQAEIEEDRKIAAYLAYVTFVWNWMHVSKLNADEANMKINHNEFSLIEFWLILVLDISFQKLCQR